MAAPRFVSMICRELNEKRIRQGLSRRLRRTWWPGTCSEILDRFYEQCMKGLPPWRLKKASWWRTAC